VCERVYACEKKTVSTIADFAGLSKVRATTPSCIVTPSSRFAPRRTREAPSSLWLGLSRLRGNVCLHRCLLLPSSCLYVKDERGADNVDDAGEKRVLEAGIDLFFMKGFKGQVNLNGLRFSLFDDSEQKSFAPNKLASLGLVYVLVVVVDVERGVGGGPSPAR